MTRFATAIRAVAMLAAAQALATTPTAKANVDTPVLHFFDPATEAAIR